MLQLLGKRDEALGKGTSLCTLSFVQAQKKSADGKNITLDVEGDADRFACELLHDGYWKRLYKRAEQVKNIKDEWNSGCDRQKLWQVHGKLVGSELTTLNAN